MYLNNHVTIIIPALNEAAAIGRVISDIPDFVDQIIVVDNGSHDDTAGVARSYGVIVTVEPKRGYGAACLAGLRAIEKTDLVGFVDGDYSDYPGEIERIVSPVAKDEADLALGCRQYEGQPGQTGLYWHQRLGNRLACRFICWTYGHQITDFGPMRCLKWSGIKLLEMGDENYGWTAEMQLKAIRHGFRIVEVPVSYRTRIGESKISGTLGGSILAGYKIFYWSIRLLFSGKKLPLKDGLSSNGVSYPE